MNIQVGLKRKIAIFAKYFSVLPAVIFLLAWQWNPLCGFSIDVLPTTMSTAF
jgi:hypothetical protein